MAEQSVPVTKTVGIGPVFAWGEPVRKVGGDYEFEGTVAAIVRKRSGALRYVVEDDRGLLFIFNEQQLERR